MKTLCATLLASFAALAVVPASAAIVTLDSSNDTWIRDGFSHAANGTGGILDNRLAFVPYIQFDLSGLNIASIQGATLNLTKVASARNDTWTAGRFLAYGLTDLAGNTAQNWDELLDFDPTDATNGLDFRNVGLEWTNMSGAAAIDATRVFNLDADTGANVTESIAGDVISLTGPDLVTFLQQRVDANGLVTFMTPINATDRGWGIASKENGTAAGPALTLDFTAVPEPGSLILFAIGGAFATMRRKRA